jgi:hypothetical protein
MRNFAALLLFFISACSFEKPQKELTTEPQIARPEESLKKAPAVVKRSTVLLVIDQFTKCTGTIVAKDKILTAHHCFQGDEDASKVVVFFGPDAKTARFRRKGKGKARFHPKLDLAVFLIESLPEGFAPVPILPVTSQLAPGDGVVIAGYGSSSSEGLDYGKFLRWGKTNFTSYEEVVKYQGGITYRSILRFESPAEGSTVCGGDSGGPVYRKFKGRWGLTGVISGGPAFCEQYSETLAADPRPNASWILAPFSF